MRAPGDMPAPPTGAARLPTPPALQPKSGSPAHMLNASPCTLVRACIHSMDRKSLQASALQQRSRATGKHVRPAAGLEGWRAGHNGLAGHMRRTRVSPPPWQTPRHLPTLHQPHRRPVPPGDHAHCEVEGATCSSGNGPLYLTMGMITGRNRALVQPVQRLVASS